MKKAVAGALSAALGVMMLTGVAFAEDSAPTALTQPKAIGIVTAPSPQEIKTITATVREISEMGMNVEDENGSTYYVPLFQFQQREDYKDLNLEVDTQVTLQGIEIKPVKLEKFTESQETAAASVDPEQSGTAPKVFHSIKLPDGKEITEATPIPQSALLTKGAFSSEAQPSEETSPTFFIRTFEGQTPENATAAGVVAVEGVPAETIPEAGKVFTIAIRKADAESGTVSVAENTLKEAPADIKVFKLPLDGKNVFLPHAITANGKTIRIK